MRLSRDVRDLLAASAFSSLLFASGVLVPIIGPAAGFFCSAPLIWLAGRHGLAAGALGGALAAALVLPALPPPVTLIFVVEHALPACYLGSRLRRGLGLAGAAARAAVVVAALVLGAALLLSGPGQDPARELERQLREGLAGVGGGAPDPALTAGLESLLRFARRALPALTLIGVFLECALNGLLAARVLAAEGIAAAPRDLTGLRLPDWLVWPLIAALALCWAPQPPLATAALNVLLPLLGAQLLVGLSICAHLAARARLTRLTRTLLLLSLAFFPWLLAVPLALGLLDFRFAFRTRWPLGAPPPA